MTEQNIRKICISYPLDKILERVTKPLRKNNRCSGCFCLQGLRNILLSKGSASNCSETRCLRSIPVQEDEFAMADWQLHI